MRSVDEQPSANKARDGDAWSSSGDKLLPVYGNSRRQAPGEASGRCVMLPRGAEAGSGGQEVCRRSREKIYGCFGGGHGGSWCGRRGSSRVEWRQVIGWGAPEGKNPKEKKEVSCCVVVVFFPPFCSCIFLQKHVDVWKTQIKLNGSLLFFKKTLFFLPVEIISWLSGWTFAIQRSICFCS